jgi:hypothetical protein
MATDEKHFSITFDEMLRLLMPQVDKADDRLARFRHYLKAAATTFGQPEPPDALSKAADWIEGYKKRGRGIEYVFYCALADEFGRWWKDELSRKRRATGASRKK